MNSLKSRDPRRAPDANAVRKTERILDAARHVFLRIGYGAAAVDTIAAVANVSKATLYTRFESKQALFAAVIERECHLCSRRMALAEQSPATNLPGALRRIAETLLDIFAEPQNVAILRLVIAEIPRFPELGTLFYEAGPAVTRDNVAAFLERHRGSLRQVDAATAAQDFISLLRGDLQVRALLGVGDLSAAARHRTAERAVDAFLRVYGINQAASKQTPDAF